MELFPVRCYTCGRVLAGLQREYEKLVNSGVPIREAMDRLGIVRTCCRTRAMNPGKYVFPGEDNYTRSATALRTTAQPSGITPSNVLSQIKSGEPVTVQKPQGYNTLGGSTLAPLAPLITSPTYQKTTSSLPALKPLTSQETISGLEGSMQNLQVTENQVSENVTENQRPRINIAPLNLEGAQLKPLADIKLPRVYFA